LTGKQLAAVLLLTATAVRPSPSCRELSVVLKGEVVTSGTTYAGLPADRVFDVQPVQPSEAMRQRFRKKFATEATPLLGNLDP